MTEHGRVGAVELTLHWRIKKQMVFFFEVDTEALAPMVPMPLELVEVRPGVSLFALELIHYHLNHFRDGYREFYEAVFAASVHPDLALDMPVPRFAMHAISVISDSGEFCHQEGASLFTPTSHVPGLKIVFDDTGSRCTMTDGDTLIARCENTAGALTYEPLTIWGQYFTATRGVQRGIWRWDGHAMEHMKPGAYGELRAHGVLWPQLDLARVHGVYRQMIARPEGTDLRFYHAGPLRPA